MSSDAPNIFRRIIAQGPPVVAAAAALLVLVPALLHPVLRVHDEGHFLLAAETIRAGIAGVFAGTPLVVLRDEIHPLGGTLYFTAKPGHIGMLVLAGLVSGGLAIRKAIVLNVLCHALAAALIAVVARRRFGAAPAAIGGVCYALAPLTVFFASGALGVSTAAMFLALAACLLDARGPSLVLPALGGCAATMAVACHYNAGLSALAIPLAFALSAGRRRVAAFVAGGVASALVIQGATMLADHALRFAYPEFQSWWGELHHALFKHHLNVVPDAAAHFSDGVRGYGAAAWLSLAHILGGQLAILSAGTLLAVIFGTRAPSADRAAVLLWALLPLAAWTLYPWKVERTFVVVAPGMAFATAAFARAAMDKPLPGTLRWLQATGLAAVFAGSAAGSFMRLREAPPPIADLIAANEDWISTAPRGTFNATSFHWKTAPLWKWQLGHERINTGRLSPGVDFARFDSPYVAAIDPQAGAPDPDFAASTAEFADGSPFGPALGEGDALWFFIVRDDAARMALEVGR